MLWQPLGSKAASIFVHNFAVSSDLPPDPQHIALDSCQSFCFISCNHYETFVCHLILKLNASIGCLCMVLSRTLWTPACCHCTLDKAVSSVFRSVALGEKVAHEWKVEVLAGVVYDT